MILVLDNYDSFVHNLARRLRLLGARTHVVRSDAIDAAAARRLAPSAVVVSPGPCTPSEAGASVEVVRALCADTPVLGVCLGHQVIAAALGGRIVRAPRPVHGSASAITHSGTGLFAGVPSPTTVGRYHSLMIDRATLPAALQVTAETEDGVVMAVEHRGLPVWGVQFHPESVLTEHGDAVLTNFLALAGVVSPPRSERQPAGSP